MKGLLVACFDLQQLKTEDTHLIKDLGPVENLHVFTFCTVGA